MKNFILALILVPALWLTAGSAFSQVGISDDGSTPNSSAILDISSSSKGFLPPRMTSEQMQAIPDPPEGMMVYCTNCNEDGCSGFYIYTWTVISGTALKTWSCMPKCIKPGAAGTITGTATVSAGQSGVSYSIPEVPSATSYTWTYTGTGFTSLSKSVSPSILANFSESATSGDLTVKANNACGSGPASAVFHITIATGNCPNFPPFTINHLASGPAAPVDKSVTYGTVRDIAGETEKCWTTQNLGASRQATSVSDDTEESAGWYWQFNRKQGYKHDGTTRTPNSDWITLIDDTSGMQAANDPCILELGNGWRLPTSTEWSNVDATGGWTTWNGPWNSNLKLHAAGHLSLSNGALTNRGTGGYYWSSTSTGNSSATSFKFNSSISNMSTSNKESAFPVRCINSCYPITWTVFGEPITGPKQVCRGQNGVTYTMVPISGVSLFSWNYTGTGLTIVSGTGTNEIIVNFSSTATSGDLQVTYSDNCITFTLHALSPITVLDNCCPHFAGFTINHVAGTTYPVTKTVTYTTVTNVPGEPSKCWIAQNLGASQQATAENDSTEASAGWYWQFNRKQGYKHTGTVRTPNSTWITSISENTGWEVSKDPCIQLGQGWRLPTSTEWNNVDGSGHWNNWYSAYKSPLHLHAAGRLNDITGMLQSRGSSGSYWSSTQSTYFMPYTMSNYLYIYSTNCYWTDTNKAKGFSVRCIRDGN